MTSERRRKKGQTAMTSVQLREHIDEMLAEFDAGEISAKQWMEFYSQLSLLVLDEIHRAPCKHDSETNYETISGRFCGVCTRRIEAEA